MSLWNILLGTCFPDKNGRGKRKKEEEATHVDQHSKQLLSMQMLPTIALLGSAGCTAAPAAPRFTCTPPSASTMQSTRWLCSMCLAGEQGCSAHCEVQYLLTILRLKPYPNFYAGNVAEKARMQNTEVKPYPGQHELTSP